jgi:hypothetical protein
METSLTVIEAYLPGAPDHDAPYYLHLVETVRASIRPHGLDVSLLVLPGDETILWLVRVASRSASDASSDAGFDVTSAVAAATASEAGHLIERHLTGRLVEGHP